MDTTTYLLLVSTTLQFLAAVLALRLIAVTGRRAAWVLISSALFLMAARRTVTLVDILSGSAATTRDLYAEIIAATTSVLMVVGVHLIGEVFSEQRAVADRLRQGEETIRTYFDRSPLAVFLADAAGNYLDVNPAACALTGYSREELLQSGLYLLPAPRAAELGRQHFERVLTTGSADGEVLLRHQDGTEFWAEVRAVKLADDRFLAFGQDVTERRRYADLARVQRDLAVDLAQAADSATVCRLCAAAAVAATDLDAATLYLVDPASGRLRAAHAIGLSPEFQAATAEYGPDSPNVALLRSGQPLFLSLPIADLPDAEAIAAEHLRSVAVVPIVHEDRLVGCLNAGSRQHNAIPEHAQAALITLASQIGQALDRQQAIEALREREEELGATFDSIDDMLFVADQEGIIRRINQAVTETLGFAAEELLGQPLTLVHPDNYHATSTAIVAQGPPREPVLTEMPLATKDGRVLPCETMISRGVWAGQPAFLGVCRDLTDRQAAAAELRLSRDRLERAEQVARSGNWEFNLRTGLVVASRGAYTIYGLTPDIPMTIQRIQQIPLPEYRLMLDEALRALVEDGQPYSVDFRIQRADDGGLVDIHSEAVYDADAQIIYGIIQDITERKRAEAELELQALVLDQIQDCVTVTDLHGRITYVNRAEERLLGYPAAALIGQSVEIYGDDPEKGARQTEIIERTLTDGGWRGEVVNYTVDGDEVILDTRTQLVTDQFGRPIALCGIASDVTQQRRAAEALRLSEERHRAIVAALPDVLLRLDASGRFTDCQSSDPNALILPANLAIGRLASEVVDPSLAEKTMAAIVTTLRTGELQQFDYEVELEHGRRTFEARMVPTSEHEVLVIARDVTDLRRAEEERLELERQILSGQKLESLGVLAGGIAHDFNNLLTAILGHADLALDELPAASPVTDSVREIELASRRAADLCRQMLAYSGRGHFVIEVVDLSELVREMTNLLTSSISKKARLTLDLAADLPAVEADATQLRQIVMNLVLNASEALGDSAGEITVTTAARQCQAGELREAVGAPELPAGQYLELIVSDTGCGMDETTRERLFEPFFTTKFTGRGLGMSAVLGIVRGHNGGVLVDSEPGRGTTFRILLPASGQVAPVAEPEPAARPAAGGNGVILVIDDDDAVRRLATRMLRRLGYDAVAVADGHHGVATYLELQQAGGVALVLLDLTMPGMDGGETLAALRAVDPAVRVVMASGYSNQEVQARFAGQHLRGVIQKPYTADVLEAVLAAALAD